MKIELIGDLYANCTPTPTPTLTNLAVMGIANHQNKIYLFLDNNLSLDCDKWPSNFQFATGRRLAYEGMGLSIARVFGNWGKSGSYEECIPHNITVAGIH